mmetsp:Transcript_81032/g.217541  ORF Transcript_81032/g.217541 Transcript_81032/m.217541 type:complete len:664 (+) Transcript_81032:1191-3182(+)
MRELEVSLAVEAGAAKVRGACIMLWARRGRHNVRQVVEARAAEETAARSKADAECDRLRELLVQARATQYSMAQALEAQCREAARLAEQDARKMTAALKSAGQAREAQVAAEARAEAAERRAAEAEQRVAVLERRGAAREEAEAAAKARLEHLNRALGLLQDRKIHELVLELQAEVRAADRRHQNCAERASVLAAELERSQAAQKSQAQMQREEAGRGVGELQRRAEAAERRAEALQARAAEAADQQARRGRSEVERVGEQLAAQRRRGDELEAALAVARRAHRDEASARSNETARLRALCDKQRLQLAAAEAAAARVAEIEAMRVAAAAAARRLQADEHQAQLVALEERLTRRAAAAEARIRQELDDAAAAFAALQRRAVSAEERAAGRKAETRSLREQVRCSSEEKHEGLTASPLTALCDTVITLLVDGPQGATATLPALATRSEPRGSLCPACSCIVLCAMGFFARLLLSCRFPSHPCCSCLLCSGLPRTYYVRRHPVTGPTAAPSSHARPRTASPIRSMPTPVCVTAVAAYWVGFLGARRPSQCARVLTHKGILATGSRVASAGCGSVRVWCLLGVLTMGAGAGTSLGKLWLTLPTSEGVVHDRICYVVVCAEPSSKRLKLVNFVRCCKQGIISGPVIEGRFRRKQSDPSRNREDKIQK